MISEPVLDGRPLRLDADDFTLFGLAPRMALDRAVIDARWRELQAQVHPDRHAAAGPAAQQRAMQWAVRVNEAYRRLKDPLQRAAALCALHGQAVDGESNTAMPVDFLMQQIEWREALDAARGPAAIEALVAQVLDERSARLARLTRAIDEQSAWPAAAAELRALMFVERFVEDLERRLDTVAGP